jgi:hypothetical protein
MEFFAVHISVMSLRFCSAWQVLPNSCLLCNFLASAAFGFSLRRHWMANKVNNANRVSLPSEVKISSPR